jgi:hypothetical protein
MQPKCNKSLNTCKVASASRFRFIACVFEGFWPIKILQERDNVERQVEELRSTCAAKVRSAEAKWAEALAVIDHLTTQKMMAPFSSSACQTDDSGPVRLHSSASQTSGEIGKHTRDDSMMSGISAIEAEYAKKVRRRASSDTEIWC